MRDNEIYQVIFPIIQSGLTARGITGVGVKQSYQPRKTGTPSAPTVFIHKLSANRYGFPGRRSVYNEARGDFDHTETIWRTPTFQVDALAVQDPSDLSALTASDLVESVADILQSSAALETLKASDIGIDRITDIRVPYFVNDEDQNEASPSFDFTLSYRVEFNTTVPAIDAYELNTRPI